MAEQPQTNRRRWALYGLLIALSTGQAAGRLAAVDAADLGRVERYRIQKALDAERDKLTTRGASDAQIERRLAQRRAELQQELRLGRPFLSANDRSRWMTVRALVEHGVYAIDDVLQEPTWDSIDIVSHRDRRGVQRVYSSKPPLLATLLAGEYWVIHQLTGWTLGTHPYTVGRIMLLTVNVLPMAAMLLLVAAVADRLFDGLAARGPGPVGDWPRLLVVAAGAMGTMLSPFVVVLNNHLVAAVGASAALYAWSRIRLQGDTRGRWFALAGAAAAFTAANELPALSLLVGLGLVLGCRHLGPALRCFAPAALLVAAAFFGTNYAAHNTLSPPYAYRYGEGEENWYKFTYEARGRQRASYWYNPRGIDRGEPSRLRYALNVLVGHHGVFSLTPVWLLSFAGMAYWARRGPDAQRELAVLVLGLSVLCLAFYIGFRPQQDRNYGGMTSGFRWMFWFAPLWLACMAPAATRCGRSRAGRLLGGTLLAASAFSAAYPTWNPWSPPWLYRWMQAGGWDLL